MEEGPSCSRKRGETCTHQRQEDIINVAAVTRQDDIGRHRFIQRGGKNGKILETHWNKNVDQCERLIKEDWDREMKMDASETHPPIIINLAEDTDEDNDEYDEEEVLTTPL
uniref:Uncharacterized protein n=1 Tax=Timema genevievae TaxID=629358 RepID=A0A7R9JWE2_TIMGE|nr:unnamed protein product [Timema genevievae]